MRAPADGRACCLRLVLSCLVCAVCLWRTCRRGLPAVRLCRGEACLSVAVLSAAACIVNTVAGGAAVCGVKQVD